MLKIFKSLNHSPILGVRLVLRKSNQLECQVKLDNLMLDNLKLDNPKLDNLKLDIQNLFNQMLDNQKSDSLKLGSLRKGKKMQLLPNYHLMNIYNNINSEML